MAEKYAVLFIDDEETVLDTLQVQLQGLSPNIEVVSAQSGEEAFKLVEEMESYGMTLALVVCDYLMPGMKGDDVLIQFNKTQPTAVKILLTGQSVFEGVTRCINEAQLYRFIAKPWNKNDLKLTIDEALKKFAADRMIAEQKRRLKLFNHKMAQMKEQLKKEQKHKNDKESEELQYVEREAYSELFFLRFFQSLEPDEKKWFAEACIGLMAVDGGVTRRQKDFLETIIKEDPRKDLVEYFFSLADSKTVPNLDLFRCDREKAFELMKHFTWILSLRRLPTINQQQYFRKLGMSLGLESQMISDFLKLARLRVNELMTEQKIKHVVLSKLAAYGGIGALS